MDFYEKYTTKEKKEADPEGEKNKTEISNDAFAVGELLENFKRALLSAIRSMK